MRTFKVFVLENHKREGRGGVWVVCIVVVCFVIVKRMGFFSMETLCFPHVLICYDLLAINYL
jgi:hypothetical protein